MNAQKVSDRAESQILKSFRGSSGVSEMNQTFHIETFDKQYKHKKLENINELPSKDNI